MSVVVKDKHDLKVMRIAGRIAGRALEKVENKLKAGISTLELDRIAKDYIRSQNAEPAFLGYSGFPNTLCVSINDEIVHGIPSKDRILKEGDIVSIDVGTKYKGFYGDTAVTLVTGRVNSLALRLVNITKYSLEESFKYAKAGNYLYDISFAVQSIAETNGFGVIRDYCGHGIGRKLHESPHILNFVSDFEKRERSLKLKKGFAFAIEPMLTTGTYKTKVLKDNWTVVTKDGGLAAHFEHSIAITDGKPIILTLPSD